MRGIYEGVITQSAYELAQPKNPDEDISEIAELFALELILSAAPDVTFRSVATQLGLLGPQLSYNVSNIYTLHQTGPRRLQSAIDIVHDIRKRESGAPGEKIALQKNTVGHVAKGVTRTIEKTLFPELEKVLDLLKQIETDSPPSWWRRCWRRLMRPWKR